MMIAVYALVSMFLLGCACGMLWRDHQADKRRVIASRNEANRAIDEYEARHGAGTSPWPKFK
jgi:outer membrane biogenesis lipoprotein LolB